MTKATECRNFVIAGHSGSGKSTLCELMLVKGGVIPRAVPAAAFSCRPNLHLRGISAP